MRRGESSGGFDCCRWHILFTSSSTTPVPISYNRHDAFIYETWHIHIWDMTHPFWDMTHSHICVICATHSFWDMAHSHTCVMCVMHSQVWDDVLVVGDTSSSLGRRLPPYLFHTWDLTHSYMRHDILIYETWHIHIWDMTHSYMTRSYTRPDSLFWGHVTHINEPCHTHQWAMSHTSMSHVTHINEPCHTYQWAMSHTSMSHVTHINKPCHTHQWAMSHTSMSHVTHINEPCHTHHWAMSTSHVTHATQRRGRVTDESCYYRLYLYSHVPWVVSLM